jgi:hypothetical protein
MPSSRILRERQTVEAMVRLYCHDHHRTAAEALCADCQALAAYAGERLAKCPFQENKTVCAKCRVHCYKVQMRERIREVMRYAGPRMPRRHPVMALQHLWDARRKEPRRARPKKNAAQ